MAFAPIRSQRTGNGNRLTLDAAANGESEFAFFRIRPATLPVTLPVTSLVFDIPQGYASGAGDALEFAFGVPLVIPEPAVAAMLLAGGAGVALSRRRSR